MKGYLYNILGEGIEELYWSSKEIDTELIESAWKEFEEMDEEYDDFETFCSDRTDLKIERVFLEEIYV